MGQGSDACVMYKDCDFCYVHTQDQHAQLASTYQLKKDKKAEKKGSADSSFLVDLGCLVVGPVNSNSPEQAAKPIKEKSKKSTPKSNSFTKRSVGIRPELV